MMPSEIFASVDVKHAHIIDDAYDTNPSISVDEHVLQSFVDAISRDEAAYSEVCKLVGLPDINSTELLEFIGHTEAISTLYAFREKFFPHDLILFSDFDTSLAAKKEQLKPLLDFLRSQNIEPETFGADYASIESLEPQFIFVDLRLIEDGKNTSVDAAVQVCKKLKQIHKTASPFVFLMSTLSDLKIYREQFRSEANLFSSQFEAVNKEIFLDSIELSAVLSRYARSLPAIRLLNQSIENVGDAARHAASRVQQELRNLDVADYFVLHRNTTSVEKIGLGTYVSDLVLEYLAHEIENTEQIWKFADGLDKWRIDDLPRSRFSLTQAAGRIYSGNILHAPLRLENEDRRGVGPTNGYFYLGDIFFLKTEAALGQPTRAVVIATPACDLVRPEDLRTRTIFLCEGDVKKMVDGIIPMSPDGISTVVLPYPAGGESQLAITWKKNVLHTWHSEDMDKFIQDKAEWVRAGRLRPLYALQLQQAVTANLSRIGTQRPLSSLRPHGIRVFVSNGKSWVVLDEQGVADSTVAAISDTGNGKRTAFIIADPTVRRIRKLVLGWISKQRAPTLPAISTVNIEGASALGSTKAPREYIPEITASTVDSSDKDGRITARDETIIPSKSDATDLSVRVPARVNAVDSASSHAAAIDRLPPNTKPAKKVSRLENVPVVETSSYEIAQILKKIVELDNFEGKVMYFDHDVPEKPLAGKALDTAAYPISSVPGLTDIEAASVAFVRKSKSSPYSTIGGGQPVKEGQIAKIVVCFEKIK